MSMYGDFKTDPKLEIEGVDLDFGSFVVRICAVGESNERFERARRKRMKPWARVSPNRIPKDVLREVAIETFAECVVLDWHRRIDGELVRGIEAPDGSTLEFNRENVEKTLRLLPKLLDVIAADAQDHVNFLAEDERGN